MRFLTAALFLIVLLVLPIGSASAAPTPLIGAQTASQTQDRGIGIRLIDIPAATQNDPRARTYIIDHLMPGTTIERRVELQNNTASSQSVRLYPGAATVKDGTFNFEVQGVENALTSWTSTSDSKIEMAPGERIEATVTINVPKDAPEAEQYGVIWAEVLSPAEDGKMAQASRAGIRIYLSVGPGNGTPAGFTIDALTAGRDTEGRPQVSATVTNTGGRAVDISGSLNLANGPAGISAGPFPMVQGTTIAPGRTAPVAVDLDPQLPTGPWEATLTLKSGLVTEEAHATLQFPEAGESTEVETSQGHGLLWTGIIVGLALLLAAAILWRTRHRQIERH